MTITATLTIVAAIESRMIKREKDFFPSAVPVEVNAILFAMNRATFNHQSLSFKNSMVNRFIRFFMLISQYWITIFVLYP
jgi:hypothetical protein